MGLDMYLKENLYFNQYKDKDKFDKLVSTLGVVDDGYGIEVLVNVGYWRKVNAIHKWFVDTLAEGVDRCQSIDVTSNDLQTLLDLCKLVKNDHSLAEELLPTGEGFFFGSCDYDEWYFEGIDQTITILENALKGDDYRYFLYQASW